MKTPVLHFAGFDAGGVEGLVRAGQQKTLLRVGPVRLFFVEMETGRVKFPRILYEGAPAGRANFRRPESLENAPISNRSAERGTERFSVDECLPEAVGLSAPGSRHAVDSREMRIAQSVQSVVQSVAPLFAIVSVEVSESGVARGQPIVVDGDELAAVPRGREA